MDKLRLERHVRSEHKVRSGTAKLAPEGGGKGVGHFSAPEEVSTDSLSKVDDNVRKEEAKKDRAGHDVATIDNEESGEEEGEEEEEEEVEEEEEEEEEGDGSMNEETAVDDSIVVDMVAGNLPPPLPTTMTSMTSSAPLPSMPIITDSGATMAADPQHLLPGFQWSFSGGGGGGAADSCVGMVSSQPPPPPPSSSASSASSSSSSSPAPLFSNFGGGAGEASLIGPDSVDSDCQVDKLFFFFCVNPRGL